jgi:hypothetical protein
MMQKPITFTDYSITFKVTNNIQRYIEKGVRA